MTARSGAHSGPTSRTSPSNPPVTAPAPSSNAGRSSSGSVANARNTFGRSARSRLHNAENSDMCRETAATAEATAAASTRRSVSFAESESVPSVVAARSVPSAAREAIVTVFVFSDDDVFVEATIVLSVA